MRGPVGADNARSIDRKHDGKILQRDVVNGLVVRALQERRIDRDDRFHAFAREPRGERHRVLLGDADVEIALRKRLRKPHESRTFAHRRRDADETCIGRRHVAEPIAENLRIGGLRRNLRNDADRRIEPGDAVIEDGIVLGAGITIAFARHDVEELRSLEIANVRQRVDERVEIVAVDRADIVEAEFLEQRARKHHALDVLFSAFRQFVQRAEFRQHFLSVQRLKVLFGIAVGDATPTSAARSQKTAG